MQSISNYSLISPIESQSLQQRDKKRRQSVKVKKKINKQNEKAKEVGHFLIQKLWRF